MSQNGRENRSNKDILLSLDRRFFSSYIRPDKPFSGPTMYSAVATWLYDQDFGVDEESWKTLSRLREALGDKNAWKILEFLFARKHDT
jgi:hypothetical protein